MIILMQTYEYTTYTKKEAVLEKRQLRVPTKNQLEKFLCYYCTSFFVFE